MRKDLDLCGKLYYPQSVQREKSGKRMALVPQPLPDAAFCLRGGGGGAFMPPIGGPSGDDP